MARKRNSPTTKHSNSRPVRLKMILGGLAVIVACVAIRQFWSSETASADSPPRPAAASSRSNRAPAAPATSTSRPRLAAIISGQSITWKSLAKESLDHHGKSVLQLMANKLLIAQECKRHGISVTIADVDAEIDRMAKPFGWTRGQWLNIIERERGVNPEYYRSDVVWQILALRRLAGARMDVTQEDMIEAYEKQYGSAVVARLIACKDAKTAASVRAKAAADPASFVKLAKDYSQDASASIGGAIPPIRKHGFYKEIEQAAFTMKDGEVSQVIPAGGQFVILKRERELPGQSMVHFKDVAPRLEEIVRADKTRAVAENVFQQLQSKAQIINVMNDPVKSRTMPSVAALINGYRLTKERLADECIKRHGPEVLDGMIGRKLIELALKKRNLQVTDAEVDAEIANMAAEWLPPKDKKPNVEGWLKLQTDEQGISVAVYRRDAVWPTVALKELVGTNFRVTQEDMQKSLEANYGPQVRALAMVFKDFRRAQRVWDMARTNPTTEYFAELAKKYSVDPSSSALGGQIPLIRKHGGEPVLEKEAFSLKEGELSSVVQVDQRYIILLCLGQTEPTTIDVEEARDAIYKDLFEKKQHAAMARYFQQMQDMATIDNLLTKTSQSPPKKTTQGKASGSR